MDRTHVSFMDPPTLLAFSILTDQLLTYILEFIDPTTLLDFLT
jgi:hypothetical protein